MADTVIDDFTDKDKVEGEGIPFWDYRQQKEILGIFVRFEKDTYGQHPVLKVGDEEVHIPNLTSLKTKLISNDKLIVGAKVKIVYKKEVTSGKSGRIYADFDVYIK